VHRTGRPRGHRDAVPHPFTDIFDEPNCGACGAELLVEVSCPNPDCDRNRPAAPPAPHGEANLLRLPPR
jgi:hypothetical protein